MQTTETTKMSAIDKALAAAKARKAAKAAAAGEAPVTDTIPAAPPVEAGTLEERAAAKVKRDEERAARKAAKAEKEAAEAAAKAERKAARAAKKAAKAADLPEAKKGPAHMKKVERARSKLPALGSEAARLFEEVTTNLSVQQMEFLAAHLLVQARAMKTLRAADAAPLPLGATVRVTGGDPKYIGAVGEVIHSQKLRAKVRLPGMADGKYVYIYTGEAEVVSDAAEAAAE